MNGDRFIADQRRCFAGSFEQFAAFGGPSVYFHRECLRAGREDFLSKRHVEMLYATLASWGMHRMGDSATTKTKLTDWQRFSGSLIEQRPVLEPYRRRLMLEMSDAAFSDAIDSLRPCYDALVLSVSDATVVANSKALHHILPELVPPIDRQYTIRFFRHPPERWLDSKGKLKLVQLPAGRDAQFKLFHDTCVAIKRLAARVEPALVEEQLRQHDVTAPKAMDNAIVNYVKLTARELVSAASAIGAHVDTAEGEP